MTYITHMTLMKLVELVECSVHNLWHSVHNLWHSVHNLGNSVHNLWHSVHNLWHSVHLESSGAYWKPKGMSLNLLNLPDYSAQWRSSLLNAGDNSFIPQNSLRPSKRHLIGSGITFLLSLTFCLTINKAQD